MRYLKVVKIDEIADGEKKIVSADDKEILLTKIEGEYFAIANKCPHMGGSLYDGTLDGYRVKCPKHGSVFDVRTGESVTGAKIAFMKIKVGDTTAYPVKVEGDDILVGIE